MPIDSSATLGELVSDDPRRSRVFEEFGIDYCCNGHRSLAEATSDAGLDLADVTQSLDIAGPATASRQTQPGGNASLAHHIVDTHHAYMWQEMPRLQVLVDKVHAVHGDRHPELADVRTAYTQAVAALDPHMTAEERTVFPAISRSEKQQLEITRVPGRFESFAETIDQLRAEHATIGTLFKQIRSLTDGYAAPEDACHSYRAMLSGLREMELDLHEHIHKENNVLFPRVLEDEKQAAAS